MTVLWAFVLYLLISFAVAGWLFKDLKQILDKPDDELDDEKQFYRREMRVYLGAIGGLGKAYMVLVIIWPFVVYMLAKSDK